MQRTLMAPVLVLLGIVGICCLMATTNLFDPLIHFIHTGVITPIQAIVCLLFTVIGFVTYFYLLNSIYGYFLPRIKAETESSGVHKGGLTQE